MYSFFNEAVLRLGVSTEQVALPRITFFYNAGILIEGHKGILGCSTDTIIFKIGKNKIRVLGKDLIIKEITADSIAVRGHILSIEEANEK